VMQLNEEYNDPGLQEAANQYQQDLYGAAVFRNGTLVPFGAAFVQETTVFREFGPLAGSTLRAAYDIAPKIGNTLSRQTFDLEARHYLRLGGSGLLATRIKGFKSTGDYPDFWYFGGNYDLRGYDYLEFAGSNALVANAELRFPLIEAALTPIGVIGGVRGVFFAGIGGAWFNNQPSSDPCTSSGYKFYTSSSETCRIPVDYVKDVAGQAILDANGNPQLIYGPAHNIEGFRLKDARASYGVGLETFALGFPIHFDWSWRTTFNKGWEDVLFAGQNGCSITGQGCSESWRKPRFAVWIGYDF
jgi:outer membrane protein assembly factor BamA